MSKLNGKRSDAHYSRIDRRSARYGKSKSKPCRYRTAAKHYNRAVRHNGQQLCLTEQHEERDCDGDVYEFETACTGCGLCGYFGFADGSVFDGVDPDCCGRFGDVDADVRRLLRSQSASWLSA